MNAVDSVECADAASGIRWLEPTAPLAPGVRTLTTLRAGGVSAGAYAGLNLGGRVGDAAEAVGENRRRLRRALALPAAPLWLRQVHGTRVVAGAEAGGEPEADAAVSAEEGRVLAVLSADCLPVVFAARASGRIAIAHAGWRGLAAGVLEAVLAALAVPAAAVGAWIGPGIGARHYEVGTQVHEAFAGSPGAGRAFAGAGPGRWRCDLALLAAARLEAAGVGAVSASGCCTYTDAARFYSYRRDGATGRMATLVWHS